MTQRTRVRIVTLLACGTLLAAMSLASAGGVAAGKPTVTVAATVTGDDASMAILVNRAKNAIASCTYVLDSDAALPCGTGTTPTKGKTTTYVVVLEGQDEGSHTVTVTVRLTDGGRSSGSDSFTIEPPHVFGLAYSNVNGTSGYQEGASPDVLIAKFVDTNRDGVPNAGDTITTNQYPRDFAMSAFGNFAVTEYVVTSTSYSGSSLGAFAGTDHFGWSNFLGFEEYIEFANSQAGAPYRTQFFDDSRASGGNLSNDVIEAGASSPSEPDTVITRTFSSLADSLGDQNFINVTMALP